MVLAQRLIDLTLFVLCALAILCVGVAVTRRLVPFGLSRLEAVTLALGLGALTVAYGVLFFRLGGLVAPNRVLPLARILLCGGRY